MLARIFPTRDKIRGLWEYVCNTHTRHLLDEVVVSESGLIRILIHQPVPFYFHLDNTDADTHLILSGSGSKRPLKLQIPANPNSLLIQ